MTFGSHPAGLCRLSRMSHALGGTVLFLTLLCSLGERSMHSYHI